MGAFILTGVVRKFALKKNIIDTPNKRSSHTMPTPRGGGVAIVLSFYAGLISLYWLDGVAHSVVYGLSGLASVAVIGFIDDHEHIPARYRLLVHFLASVWGCYWFGIVPWGSENSISYWFFWGVSILYLVWLLNLYNFMDGIDGIATIEAISVTASAGVLLFLNGHTDLLPVLFILIAALTGFLFWNWPPARIFMGDVGSAYIGILLGGLSLITANNGSLDFVIWLILLAVFISDATYTLLVRFVRGDKIYEAHRSHAYQNLSRRFGHKAVTLGILFINVFWLLPLSLLANKYSHSVIFIIIIAYLPLFLIAKKNNAGLPEST